MTVIIPISAKIIHFFNVQILTFGQAYYGICYAPAPPVPPFPIINVTTEWVPQPGGKHVLMIQWEPPDPVGVLAEYEVWIGRRPLLPKEEGDNPNIADIRLLYREHIPVSSAWMSLL